MRHVCDRCNGDGWVDKLGAFGETQLDEWFGDDYLERDQFFQDYKSGVYGEPCPICKGNKVVDDFVCVDCGETQLPGKYDIIWTQEDQDENPEVNVGRSCTNCNYDYAGESERAYFARWEN